MFHVLRTSPVGKSPWRSLAFGLVLALAGLAANVANAQTMVGLGYLPGDNISTATGVSADGSKVVGYSYDNSLGQPEAFVWTAATGMVGLGYIPGAVVPSSTATGVSADGSTVVGVAVNGQGGEEAFI